MAAGDPCCEIDALERRLEARDLIRDQKQSTRDGRIFDELVELGKSVAKLDERTTSHEKRMDRAEGRAAGFGGAAGVAGGLVIGWLKSYLPGAQ